MYGFSKEDTAIPDSIDAPMFAGISIPERRISSVIFPVAISFTWTFLTGFKPRTASVAGYENRKSAAPYFSAAPGLPESNPNPVFNAALIPASAATPGFLFIRFIKPWKAWPFIYVSFYLLYET